MAGFGIPETSGLIVTGGENALPIGAKYGCVNPGRVALEGEEGLTGLGIRETIMFPLVK